MRIRRASVPIASLCVVALMLGGSPAIGPAAAGTGSTCRTTSAGSANVQVCLLEPSDGEALSGLERVRATVSVSNDTPVIGLQASIEGVTVIDDGEEPWEFQIPTDRYADGSYRLRARAVIGTTMHPVLSGWTRIGVGFDNGNASTPGPTSGFDPPTVHGSRIVVGSVGDGADGGSRAQRVIDRIATWDPDLFLYTGDVYDDGSREEFASWYGSNGQAWSVFRDVTAPTLGNHEYLTENAQPYFDYWNGVPHAYAFDAGAWRVIVLDSTKDFGQYLPGSPQFEWLRAELEGGTPACTLVSAHHPRYSVGKYTGSPWLQSIWSLLTTHGVDVLLTGHDHNYQRWKPLGSNGTQSKDGVRQFIVGTGGHETYAIQRNDPRTAFAVGNTDGALRLELRADRALYSFVKPNGTVLDSGKFPCSVSDQLPPTAPADDALMAESSPGSGGR